MRELIYLSERKLREFQELKPRGRRWGRVHQLGATAPMNLGGVQVSLSEQAASEHPDLARVLHHVDHAWHPKRFSEEGVTAGEWVHFDASLNYKLLDGRPNSGQPALLFWEPCPQDVTYWPTRLLLHGSPEHLVGGLAAQQLPVEGIALRRSAASGLVDLLTGSGLTDGGFPHSLENLLRDLDQTYPAEVASRMSGYARVTASVEIERSSHRVIVASPLYVEYTPR